MQTRMNESHTEKGAMLQFLFLTDRTGEIQMAPYTLLLRISVMLKISSRHNSFAHRNRTSGNVFTSARTFLPDDGQHARPMTYVNIRID